MRSELRKPLPSEAVKPHPTKTYLSSIKAIYVTERLNDVFGIGSWTLKTDMVERSDGGNVVVKDILEIPEYGIYLESFGGNDNGGENSKNFDLGDAYKGASTDALTKICSYLEIGIDVFKGKAGNNTQQAAATKTATTEQPKYAEDNRPWLTEKAFVSAVTRIEAGEKDVFDKTVAAFRIKKDYKTILEAAKNAA